MTKINNDKLLVMELSCFESKHGDDRSRSNNYHHGYLSSQYSVSDGA